MPSFKSVSGTPESIMMLCVCDELESVPTSGSKEELALNRALSALADALKASDRETARKESQFLHAEMQKWVYNLNTAPEVEGSLVKAAGEAAVTCNQIGIINMLMEGYALAMSDEKWYAACTRGLSLDDVRAHCCAAADAVERLRSGRQAYSLRYERHSVWHR